MTHAMAATGFGGCCYQPTGGPPRGGRHPGSRRDNVHSSCAGASAGRKARPGRLHWLAQTKGCNNQQQRARPARRADHGRAGRCSERWWSEGELVAQPLMAVVGGAAVAIGGGCCCYQPTGGPPRGRHPGRRRHNVHSSSSCVVWTWGEKSRQPHNRRHNNRRRGACHGNGGRALLHLVHSRRALRLQCLSSHTITKDIMLLWVHRRAAADNTICSHVHIRRQHFVVRRNFPTPSSRFRMRSCCGLTCCC